MAPTAATDARTAKIAGTAPATARQNRWDRYTTTPPRSDGGYLHRTWRERIVKARNERCSAREHLDLDLIEVASKADTVAGARHTVTSWKACAHEGTSSPAGRPARGAQALAPAAALRVARLRPRGTRAHRHRRPPAAVRGHAPRARGRRRPLAPLP